MATGDRSTAKPLYWDRLNSTGRKIHLHKRIAAIKEQIALSGPNARHDLLRKLTDATDAANAGLFEIALNHLAEAEEEARGDILG